MTLRDHLGPHTPENAALHDELDRLEANRDMWKAMAKTAEAGLDATYGKGWRGQCVHGKWDWEACGQCSRPTATITLTPDAYDRLLAARAVALEKAAKHCDKIAGNTLDFNRDYRRSAGLCSHIIRALATTSSTAALDRVIRAHVQKALEIAREAVYDFNDAENIGKITADDVLREMGGRG
ncbi:hypothetical protein [Neotabrizicola sp. sgz301269]|uniref:hypothetical protein n=1 Tax=Neotabrizicola sp. sgz301269 TaxID=3276282 RepID=UPI00376F49BB